MFTINVNIFTLIRNYCQGFFYCLLFFQNIFNNVIDLYILCFMDSETKNGGGCPPRERKGCVDGRRIVEGEEGYGEPEVGGSLGV